MRPRRYDVDWLRAFAMLVVFYFHSAKFFDDGWWHLKNAQLSFGLSVFTTFVNVWMMPLFFLISGFGSRYSLESRTGAQYVVERLKRLLVPLVFGTLVIIPPQVYLERISKSQFHGSYWQFYPKFFHGVYPTGNFSWHHLWFLAYLLVFSLIALPLFLRLRRDGAGAFVSRLAALGQASWGLFLLVIPAIPLFAISATLGPLFPGLQNLVNDWANFTFSITLFIYGYLLASDAGFSEAIKRHWTKALGGAIVVTLVLAYVLINHREQRGYSLGATVFTAGRALDTWLWLVAILGLGQRFLSFTNRAQAYVNEAVLPFYVTHQTVIIIIGFFVIQWHVGVAAKYLVIASTAFCANVLVYATLVRPWNPMRFLFGMRVRRRRQ
jgi:glucan biosynthesis protein C